MKFKVNHNLPRTFGDGFIHISHIDALVYHDDPMPQMKIPGFKDRETDAREKTIQRKNQTGI